MISVKCPNDYKRLFSLEYTKAEKEAIHVDELEIKCPHCKSIVGVEVISGKVKAWVKVKGKS